MPGTGYLEVRAVKGDREKFVVWLMNPDTRAPIESSRELTEAGVRELLSESYGESEANIEARVKSARENPAI